jgi:hypothetical protein
MKKRVLIIAGVALLIAFLIAGGLFVYRVRQGFLAAREVPGELKEAKVIQGADRFSKEVLFTEPDLCVITDFEYKANHELVVVGQNGAAFLTEGNSFHRSIHFERCNSDVVSVELGSGVLLCRGTWNTNTALFDIGGKTLWSYGGGLAGIDDAAAGALGPNASKRIVVGFNGDGGVRLLSSEGKELWKRDDGNVWHVEITSPAGKSPNVILHSNARGQLTVRDENGNVLGRYDAEIYLASFAMTAWGDDSDLNKLLASDKGLIYVLTADGRPLCVSPLPAAQAWHSLKERGCIFRRACRTLSGFCVTFGGAAHYCTSMMVKTSWFTMKYWTMIVTHYTPPLARTELKICS